MHGLPSFLHQNKLILNSTLYNLPNMFVYFLLHSIFQYFKTKTTTKSDAPNEYVIHYKISSLNISTYTSTYAIIQYVVAIGYCYRTNSIYMVL